METQYLPGFQFTFWSVSDKLSSTTGFSSSKFDHVTPLLRQLHWLSAPWGINIKQAVLAFKCLHGLAPSYLADELHHPAETEFRQRLWSDSSPALSVSRTRLSTYGDQAFPVAAARVWTVFLSTSHLRRHSPPSAFVSRHTIIIFVIRSTFVRVRHFVILDTLFVFTYLLTY